MASIIMGPIITMAATITTTIITTTTICAPHICMS